MIRVLLVDDHKLVRDGIKWMLVNEPSIEVVGEASNGGEMFDLLTDLTVDVVLLDIRMESSSGLESLETLQREVPESKVVMLSTYDNPTYVARAVALGATDYVLKGSDRETLLGAIRAAADGTGPIESGLLVKVAATMKIRKKPDDPQSSLTKRELQVLRHIALGLSNTDIG
ncbi:MAG: response regulator transcription factor, partial [Acidobacteria bacterium]|nr:response regulator transcription factor [Acidobacteriota bacterium]